MRGPPGPAAAGDGVARAALSSAPAAAAVLAPAPRAEAPACRSPWGSSPAAAPRGEAPRCLSASASPTGSSGAPFRERTAAEGPANAPPAGPGAAAARPPQGLQASHIQQHQLLSLCRI